MQQETQKIISREDARAQGCRRFYTGKGCKYGHCVERFVSSGACVECHKQYNNKPPVNTVRFCYSCGAKVQGSAK